MKTTLLILIALAISLTSFGQVPEVFKYQAVVRDVGGVILANQAVGCQLTILQGSPSGTAVYTETFSPTTNNYGLVNIEIGTGTTVDDFTAIDWANGPFYIETAVDVTGGSSYSVMGTSQLLSVPYALYAKSADNVTNDQVDDADADPNNELQAISFSNDTLYLSNGGQVYLGAYGIDLIDDADSDPNNELQALSLSNDTLYLSNGNNVFLGGLNGFSNIPEVRAGQNSLTDAFVPHDIDITFSSPMPTSNYAVAVAANKKYLNGGGALWITNKTINGFTINVENINGGSVLPVIFYWTATAYQ